MFAQVVTLAQELAGNVRVPINFRNNPLDSSVEDVERFRRLNKNLAANCESVKSSMVAYFET